MMLTEDERKAITSFMEFGADQLGIAQQGMFSGGGWCYEQLKGLLERDTKERAWNSVQPTILLQDAKRYRRFCLYVGIHGLTPEMKDAIERQDENSLDAAIDVTFEDKAVPPFRNMQSPLVAIAERLILCIDKASESEKNFSTRALARKAVEELVAEGIIPDVLGMLQDALDLFDKGFPDVARAYIEDVLRYEAYLGIKLEPLQYIGAFDSSFKSLCRKHGVLAAYVVLTDLKVGGTRITTNVDTGGHHVAASFIMNKLDPGRNRKSISEKAIDAVAIADAKMWKSREKDIPTLEQHSTKMVPNQIGVEFKP